MKRRSGRDLRTRDVGNEDLTRRLCEIEDRRKRSWKEDLGFLKDFEDFEK